jgi:hypothetical protein
LIVGEISINMSGWGAWFGGGAAKKRDAPKNAILQLRGQLEMLSKREKHLQNQMEEQESIARKNVSTNKKGKLIVSMELSSLDGSIAFKARTQAHRIQLRWLP